jgi:hypothetical protein
MKVNLFERNAPMAEGTPHWQLDRRISLGHLLTTATFLVAMMLWGGRMETRIALLEESPIRQSAVDARQDAETLRVRQEVRDELRRLNEKLDRIYEERWKAPPNGTPAAGRA